MKYIFSLVIFLVFGQILSWYDNGCGWEGCHRRRHRRRRNCGIYGCGGYWGGRDDYRFINNNANANSNAISINTGDFGSSFADSRANAINAVDA